MQNAETFTIDQLKTSVAKREASRLRSLGVTDANMRFIRDGDGTETIVINKSAVMGLAKNSPLDPSRRISNLLDMGVPLDLDDELQILAQK